MNNGKLQILDLMQPCYLLLYLSTKKMATLIPIKMYKNIDIVI